MEGINPVDNGDAFDVATLAGSLTPGILKVTGFKRSHDWDEKKAKGSSGATLTDSGEPLAKGKFEIQLWDAAGFVAWDLLRPLLKVSKTTKKALEVLHPYLADLEIFAVVVEDFSQPEDKGGGLHIVEINLKEYRAPAPSGGTAGSAAAATGWKNNPAAPPKTADDVAAEELAQLRALAAVRPGQL